MESLAAQASSDLSVKEIGDGNLNLVFIVTNSKNGKQTIVKQVNISYCKGLIDRNSKLLYSYS